MKVDSSGGPITSTTAGSAGAAGGEDGEDSGADTASEPKPKPKPKAGGKSGSELSASSASKAPKRLSVTTEAGVSGETKAGSSTQRVGAVEESVGQPNGSSATQVPVQRSVVPTALTDGTASDRAVQALVSAPAAPDSAVSRMSTMLSWVGLAPSADGDVPDVPGDSPLLLAGLAAFRRQTQQALTEDAALARTVDDPSQSSLMLASADAGAGESMLMAAEVTNSAPTVSPVVGSPDQATGAVRVSLNATDADGNPLTYSVTGQPTGGSVVALGSGEFTYTPSASSRLAAATTATPDFDSFTVSISDGQGGVTPVTVTVPKLPAVWANQASSSNVTGASPYGMALVGDLAYVADQGTNTVTVVNTKTGAVVVNPIQVGTAPTGVLANADGSKVYVTNRTDGTVSVIRTSDNAVIGSVKVGTSPEFMALNDTGTRLYVTNYGSSSVSVIDTATNKLVDVNPSTTTVDAIKVGAYPRSIAFTTVNGQPRLYVVSRAGNSVSVVDANTYQLIDANPATRTVDSIKVGSTPEMIAIRDGYAYVTNSGSNTVSVINTATNKVEGSAIPVGSKPAGVTLSGDGSLLYVANGNDTVSVINTKTRALVTTLQVDPAPETNYHIIAVRSDGSLVVTDMADKAVRVVAFTRGNTAPVAIDAPSVGAADPTNGAVSGSINIKDWDGDPLSYSAVVAPINGSVTFDPSAGTYTYTPTQAARNAAAQTPANDTFTIRATDTYGAYKDASVTVAIAPAATTGSPGTSTGTSVDPITGAVRGSLGVNDPGNTLSYTVISAPTKGTVRFAAGSYTYTPTQAARLVADQTTGSDADSFTVRVSNGQTSSDISVSVPVSPAQLTVVNSFAPALGNGAGTMDLTDRRAYVLNQADGTVSVIDIPSGANVGTIPVETGTTSIAIQSDGWYLYSLNASNGTLSIRDLVFNPGTVRTVQVGSQPSEVEADIPGVLFVTNKGSGTVSVVNPSSAQVVQTYQVGGSPTAMAVDLNDNRIYVANSAGNNVSVINTANSTVASITVGATPTAMQLSPDGTKVYVTKADGTVSVISTATKTVVGGPISVGPQPSGVAVSADGSLVYVANSNDTVSIIDARTNTVVRTITIDSAAENGFHDLAISRDGRVYVTDTADRTVRSIAMAPSPAPQIPATATPIPVVANPIAVARAANNNLYVVSSDPNTLAGTVTVVNPSTNNVITTIAVGAAPTAVAASPTTNRIYVTNFNDNTVSVIDTNTNTVIDTITVDVQQMDGGEWPTWQGVTDAVVSGDGGRLYVAASDGLITVIDTSNKSVVGHLYAGSDMQLSPNGRLLYVTGGDSVAVYDTVSLSSVGRIPVGPYQFDSSQSVVVNAAGTRAYVTETVLVVERATGGYSSGYFITDAQGVTWRVVGSYAAVSVIDTADPASATYNTEIANIPIVGGASGLAINSDGSRVYVTAADGKTVTVLDTSTNIVVGAVTTDQNAGSYQSIVVGANGTLYVTDYYDSAVYAVTVGNPQV